MPKKYKRYRNNFDFSYSLGVYPTLELLKYCSEHVEHVFIKSGSLNNEGVSEIIKLCEELSLPLDCEDRIIDNLSPREDCNALGVFHKYDTDLDREDHHLVLVNPGDMGNLGAVLRSMVGLNIRNLALVRPAADIWNPRVIRASMGAVFQTRFQYFNQFEDYYNLNDHPVYSFTPLGVEELRDVKFKYPSSLVFGNEGAGLPPAILSHSTTVRIAHDDSIDSLNLAVSVGIVLYQISQKEHQ